MYTVRTNTSKVEFTNLTKEYAEQVRRNIAKFYYDKGYNLEMFVQTQTTLVDYRTMDTVLIFVEES